MSKRNENCYGVGDGYTSWNDGAEGEYATGHCYTKQGIIELYRQDDFSQAIIIHNGRMYSLNINESITKLGLVRIAKKWAREKREQ